MAAGTPWSIKGIDPKARAIAKSAARKEGMTLGEWLNSVILEDGTPSDMREKPWDKLSGFPGFPRPGGGGGDDDGPGDDHELGQIVQRLSERLEAAEQRSALALTGVDHSVLNLARRIERMEEEREDGSSEVEDALERTRSAQEELLDRIRKLERKDPANITPDSVKAIETAVGKIAQRLYETENNIRTELQDVEKREDRTQAALDKTAKALATRVEDIEKRARGEYQELKDLLDAREQRATQGLQGLYDATRSMQDRLSQAEDQTENAAKALTSTQEQLERKLHDLDERMAGAMTSQGFQRRFEHLSDELAQVIARTRNELANELARASQDPRVDKLESALHIAEKRIEAAEKRQSEALNKIGNEITRMARAMNTRLSDTERRVKAHTQTKTPPKPTPTDPQLEARLNQVRQENTEAVKRIGEEVSKLGANLADRVNEAEARSAAAVEAAGERMAQMLERLESQRVASPEADLDARLSASEERTARRIEEAMTGVQDRIDAARAETHEALSPVQRAMTALAERLEAIEGRHVAPSAAETPPEPAPPAPFATPAPAQQTSPAPTPYDEDDLGEWIEATPSQPAQTVSSTPSSPPASHAQPAAQRDELPLPPGMALDTPQTAPASADPVQEEDAFVLNTLAEDAGPAPQAAQAKAKPAPKAAPKPDPKPAPLGATANAEFLAAARKSTRTGQNSYNQAANNPGFTPLTMKGLSLPKAQSGRLLLIGLLALGFLTLVSAFGLLLLDRSSGPKEPASVSPDAISELFASNGVRSDTQEPTPPPAQTEAEDVPVVGGETDPRPFEPALSRPSDEGEVNAEPAPASPLDTQPVSDTGSRPVQAEPAALRMTLEAAAAQGNPIARYQLGLQLYEQDRFDDAIALIRRSAEQGVPAAQYRYAKMLERGEGVTQNFAEAALWNEQAADAGHGRAMHNMGVLLVTGNLGEPDYAAAKQWFQLAALHGVTDSQHNLAIFFERGMGGTVQSLPDAYAWYMILANNGDEAAIQRAAVLRDQISDEARVQAEATAVAFTPRPLTPEVQGNYGPQPWSSEQDSVSVQRAQALLADKGYDVGPADGAYGPKTREAIIAYQTEHNLDQTGVVDAALIARLERTDGR